MRRLPHLVTSEDCPSQGDLADDMETQLLPHTEAGLPFDDRDVMARHPWTLRHVLAALENL